ncbi:MAG: hypothetical protein IJQ21_07865 [Lachnospiraceae bacterium]|nr:hypothetical protein [Lachnospiraceae bacterium]
MNLKQIILTLSVICLLLAGCGKEPLETAGGLRNDSDAESTGRPTNPVFPVEAFNPVPAASALMARNTVSYFFASLTRGNALSAVACVSGNAAPVLLELLLLYDPAGSMIRTSGLPLSEQMQARADAHTEALLRACFRDYSIDSLERLSATQYTATVSVTCVDAKSFAAECGNVTYEDLLLTHAQDAARVTAEQGEDAAYEYLITMLIDHLEEQLRGQLAALPAQVYPAAVNIELTGGKWLITDLQLYNG